MTNPANRPALQSTLREVQAVFRRPRLWGAIGASILIAALIGPFYTLERLDFPARLLYWALVGGCSGVLITALIVAAHRLNDGRWPGWLADALGASLGILPVMGFVHAANLLSGLDSSRVGYWDLLPYVAVPVVAIAVIVGLLMPRPAPAVLEVTTDTPEPLLFDKLPKPLGRDLICMQAQDHYIEVTTTLGKAMVLMRLGDAEQGLNGQRVHRSWWVNLAHVERSEKSDGGGMDLIVRGGTRVPVARAQRPAIRALLSGK